MILCNKPEPRGEAKKVKRKKTGERTARLALLVLCFVLPSFLLVRMFIAQQPSLFTTKRSYKAGGAGGASSFYSHCLHAWGPRRPPPPPALAPLTPSSPSTTPLNSESRPQTKKRTRLHLVRTLSQCESAASPIYSLVRPSLQTNLLTPPDPKSEPQGINRQPYTDRPRVTDPSPSLPLIHSFLNLLSFVQTPSTSPPPPPTPHLMVMMARPSQSVSQSIRTAPDPSQPSHQSVSQSAPTRGAPPGRTECP